MSGTEEYGAVCSRLTSVSSSVRRADTAGAREAAVGTVRGTVKGIACGTVRGEARRTARGTKRVAASGIAIETTRGTATETVRGTATEKITTATKGAATLEAATVLPLLLCAFFSVVFLIKTVYTYSLIQHSLSETATEIASAGYIYHISGIRDLHDTVRDTINDRTDLLKDQVESVVDAYDYLCGSGIGPYGDTGESSGSSVTIGDLNEKFGRIFDYSRNIAADPLDEIKTIVCYIAGGAFDDAKTQLFIPIVRRYMKKHLITEDIPDVDERLRYLNIVNGFSGLDFSESSFLSDRNEDIDIVVCYRIRLPLPVNFAGELEIVQRARAKAWLGGDTKKGVLGDDGDTSAADDDVWSLSNFQRGLKLRRMFGANLPNSFPVIARFDAGRAVMIKSMDLTAASYQDGNTAEKTLKGYLKELEKFQGQEKPWGSDGIVIRKEDIRQKELILIIPENKLSDRNEALLNDIVRYADSMGINMNIERYGMKRIEDNADESNDKE